jgi:hypothetical protein
MNTNFPLLSSSFHSQFRRVYTQHLQRQQQQQQLVGSTTNNKVLLSSSSSSSSSPIPSAVTSVSFKMLVPNIIQKIKQENLRVFWIGIIGRIGGIVYLIILII